jgi:hypothetical protein
MLWTCSRYVCLDLFQCIFKLSQARFASLTLSQIVQMRKDAKQCHEELVALLESDSDLTSCENSSVSFYLYLVVGSLSSCLPGGRHSGGCGQ